MRSEQNKISERPPLTLRSPNEATSEVRRSAERPRSEGARGLKAPSLYIRLQETKNLHTMFDLRKHTPKTPQTLEKIFQ